MSILIGELNPTQSYDGSGFTNQQYTNDGVPSGEFADVTEKVDITETTENKTTQKKTNWYLYAVLGVIAVALIMNSKK